MYLTEIPKSSVSWLSSVVNVYMIVNQRDATFYSFQQQSTWMQQASNHDFISGK